MAVVVATARHYLRRRRPGAGVTFTSASSFSGSSHQESLGIYADHHGERRLIKPERIIIVRHGESMGNLDESTYVHVPDWKIPLTKQGYRDARIAGQKIKEHVGDKPLFIYTSPYLRTKQTLAGLVEAFDTNYIVGVREEPRLTEQQFGNFQNLATIRDSKQDRARFGRFYYRFPEGESGLDVYNRATSFIATMFRDFANDQIARDDLNIVIVTHGLTLRLLVMRWFQYSISDFENTFNPPNGGYVVMERQTSEVRDTEDGPVSPSIDGQGDWVLTEGSLALLNYPRPRTGAVIGRGKSGGHRAVQAALRDSIPQSLLAPPHLGPLEGDDNLWKPFTP